MNHIIVSPVFLLQLYRRKFGTITDFKFLSDMTLLSVLHKVRITCSYLFTHNSGQTSCLISLNLDGMVSIALTVVRCGGIHVGGGGGGWRGRGGVEGERVVLSIFVHIITVLCLSKVFSVLNLGWGGEKSSRKQTEILPR